MASALPYVAIPTWTIELPFVGEHELSVFGPLVLVGVIVGYRLVMHYARVRGLELAVLDRMSTWIVLVGFASAHWVSMLLYYPGHVAADPWVLLHFGSGLSSVGGFVGGVLTFVVMARRSGLAVRAHADAIAFGLLAGFTVGRVGCSLVHDHPGALASSDDLLAVGPWPDGVWRYDLALVELAGLLVACLLVYAVLDWRRAAPGRLTAIIAILYSAGRFPLDFLRAADTRYLGLTPAQYACLAFILVGAVLLLRTFARGDALSSAALLPEPASPPASASRVGPDRS
jgi:phosphatidylglycerol:prolipoprotein diacylglycerol transferase